jgi:hypothetical protein
VLFLLRITPSVDCDVIPHRLVLLLSFGLINDETKSVRVSHRRLRRQRSDGTVVAIEEDVCINTANANIRRREGRQHDVDRSPLLSLHLSFITPLSLISLFWRGTSEQIKQKLHLLPLTTGGALPQSKIQQHRVPYNNVRNSLIR